MLKISTNAVQIHARTVEVAPTWSMVSVVRVLRDTMGMIVAMVCIIASMNMGLHIVISSSFFFSSSFPTFMWGRCVL